VLDVLRHQHEIEVGAVAEHHLAVAVVDDAARRRDLDVLDAVVLGDLAVIVALVDLHVPEAEHQQAGDQDQHEVRPQEATLEHPAVLLEERPHSSPSAISARMNGRHSIMPIAVDSRMRSVSCTASIGPSVKPPLLTPRTKLSNRTIHSSLKANV